MKWRNKGANILQQCVQTFYLLGLESTDLKKIIIIKPDANAQ